jgi:hypothetical protein
MRLGLNVAAVSVITIANFVRNILRLISEIGITVNADQPLFIVEH